MNIKKFLSFAFVIAIFAFLLVNISKNWDLVRSFQWKFNVEDLLLLVLLVIPIYILNAFSWHLITKSLGIKVSFLTNLRIWTTSNLARFLPGGIWQYPGRVYLLSQEGSTKHIGTIAVVIEVLLNIGVGSIIILWIVIFWEPSLVDEKFSWVIWILIFIPLLLLISSNKLIMSSLVQLVDKIKGRKSDLVPHMPLRWLPLLGVSFALQYFLSGTVLFILSREVVELPITLLPIFIGIYTVAWLIGYVTVIAPSGLGVQEASIAGLLSIYMPLPVAGLVAIGLRLSLLVSEFLVLLLVFVFLKKSLKNEYST